VIIPSIPPGFKRLKNLISYLHKLWKQKAFICVWFTSSHYCYHLGAQRNVWLKMLHIQKRQVFIKILLSSGIWRRVVFMNITTFQRNFCRLYHSRWHISTWMSTGYSTATQTLKAPYSSGKSTSDYKTTGVNNHTMHTIRHQHLKRSVHSFPVPYICMYICFNATSWNAHLPPVLDIGRLSPLGTKEAHNLTPTGFEHFKCNKHSCTDNPMHSSAARHGLSISYPGMDQSSTG
jgi:hypothetical protein